MHKIKVHGMVLDNAGGYHQAGAELVVDDDRKPGHIAEKRAEQLVGINSASPVGAATGGNLVAQAEKKPTTKAE